MRRLLVWSIAYITGMASAIILTSPTPVFGRLLITFILCFAASFVFDMALKAYTVHEFQNVRWSVTTTVEPAETEEV